MREDTLREIEQRVEDATEGPWQEYTALCCPDRGGITSVGGLRAVCPESMKMGHHPMAIEDARFCANAISDVPSLIAEVRRLRVMLAEAMAEAIDFTGGRICPFCSGRFGTPDAYAAYDRFKDRPHGPECTAFTPDGAWK